MQQQRRRHYLQALGITLYQRRQPGAPAGARAPSSAEIAATAAPETAPASAALPPARAAIVFEGAAEGHTDAAGEAQLQQLCQEVAGCARCALSKTRTQTVFGTGPVLSACMLIGEGPGAEEDRQGEPFVGRAGQLLNRMLAAIGLSRSQVYIANAVKCRPPGNRNPQSEEIAACEDYLKRQIALVRPRVIVALGRIAAQRLTHTTASIKHLRTQSHRYADGAIPLLVTYHPAYLLRNPSDKGKVWDDLKRLRDMLAAP